LFSDSRAVQTEHTLPAARTISWLAHDAVTWLRVEIEKEAWAAYRHGLTPAFSTRQESSALIRRFWGTPSPWTRKY
jgi:hypothetical protein